MEKQEVEKHNIGSRCLTIKGIFSIFNNRNISKRLRIMNKVHESENEESNK